MSEFLNRAKTTYHSTLEWLVEYEGWSFWMVALSLSFITLFILYLLVCNFRLHWHIAGLDRDKKRLMEEKDLMRRAVVQSEVKEENPTIEKKSSQTKA